MKPGVMTAMRELTTKQDKPTPSMRFQQPTVSPVYGGNVRRTKGARAARYGLYFCIAFTLLFWFTVELSAQSDTTMTTLSGQVANGTGGADPPGGFTVFALVIDENAESIVGRVETVTEPDGSFFIDVATADPGQFYRVVVDDGIYTPYVDVLPDFADEPISLTVYQRTTSLDEISVTSYSMVIPVVDASQRVIGVLSAVNLVNTGDEVYVADLTDPDLTGFNLLRFNLPVGYHELTVESDLPSGNVMEIGTGFAISNPVPPGEYSMVISYSAPFEDGEFSYPLRLPFGAETVSILLPEDAGTVTGLGLMRSEAVAIGDGQYIRYDGSDYERRAELGVVISGLPKPGISDQVSEFFDSTQFRIAIVASVALGLVAVVLYVVFVARRTTAKPTVSRLSTEGDADGARSTIIEAIAELDELRDLGKIEEDDYLAQRQRLVQRAISDDSEQ